MVFNGSDHGGVKIILHVKVEDFNIAKDERATITDIDAYLQGKYYRKIGVYTVGNKIISLNLNF